MIRARALRTGLNQVATLSEQLSQLLAMRAPDTTMSTLRRDYYRSLERVTAELKRRVVRMKGQSWPRLPRAVEANRLRSAYVAMEEQGRKKHGK